MKTDFGEIPGTTFNPYAIARTTAKKIYYNEICRAKEFGWAHCSGKIEFDQIQVRLYEEYK